MELAYRKGSDAFVLPGSYRRLETRLRDAGRLGDVSAVVLSCFDPATRMMPFVLYDRRMFPAGARTVAGALRQAGFHRTRAVFQLWNPNFQPSQARLDSRPPQLLLISAMQIHAAAAYQAVRDAWVLGDERPLILVGGPKAFHEPYHFWSLPTQRGPVAPDAAVTGEAYVLLDLLNVLQDFRRPGEHLRLAFERARHGGALDAVPGLVYLDPRTTLHQPLLVDTGLQRLVQHLDELPDEVTGLSLLEPPHPRAGLSAAPLADDQVRRYNQIASLLITQGCKFNCSYCPIPALNQKTWRFRSPENLVRQLRSIRERFGIKYYFGADDNFMNRRQTAEEFFEALARAQVTGPKRLQRLGHQIRWGTEATQHDTWKNRDLLPLASQAGLAAIWFGIEDLTAELINKGQKPEVTAELFRLMHRHKICPMAMMMYHDGQPFYSPGSLYGLANQMDFLRQAGAVSVQVTVHNPAVGTREYETTFASGRVLSRVGSTEVNEAMIDGNHVMIAGKEPCWLKQLKHLAGYFRFYNPLNLFRAGRDDGSPLRFYRVGYQIAGFLGVLRTAFKMIPYALRLVFGKKEFAREAPPLTRVPVRLADGAFPRFPDGAVYAETFGSPPQEPITVEHYRIEVQEHRGDTRQSAVADDGAPLHPRRGGALEQLGRLHEGAA
jgi:radical SAM superfamily enzyme YgiQ (UPF0313 family)